MSSPLSPAAQAVLDAADIQDLRDAIPIAAALRAAVEQAVPEQKPWHRTGLPGSTRHDVRAELLAIADELDPPNA